MAYLLYSQTQKAYHRSNSAEEIVADNLEILIKGQICDYVIVGKCEESEDKIFEKFEKIKNFLGRPGILEWGIVT